MSSYAQGSGPTDSGALFGSIITIIVVTMVVTTTVTYSAGHLATMTSTTSTSTTSSSAVAALAWGTSTSYPTEIWTQSCVASGGYVYCVGGVAGIDNSDITSSTYFAPLSQTGVGPWTQTTSYPTSIRSGSCVAWAGMMYCIGGVNSTAITNDVYYATLSSSGVGAWKATTSYPSPIWTQSCAPSSFGVYCVGGNTPAETGTSGVYFAPYSSAGLGAWTNTTGYPVGVRQESCVATSSDLYCVGGLDNTAVYYATVSSAGVGRWTNTTVYPFTVGANLLSCVTVSGWIYCMGGHTGPNVSDAVYHAPLSTSGVGQWVEDTNYPVAVWGLSCVSSDGAIFCSGGETSSGAVVSNVAFSPTS